MTAPTPISDAAADAATGNYVEDMLRVAIASRKLEKRLFDAETELGEAMVVLGKALYPEADLVAGEVLELAKSVGGMLVKARAAANDVLAVSPGDWDYGIVFVCALDRLREAFVPA
jgi:hypothetical protein